MLAAAGGNAALLLELGAVILTLAIAARVSDRAGLSPVPVYLIAGLLLGQIGEGPLSFSSEVIEIGAEIGLVLLLFMLGLEFTGQDLASSLQSGRRSAALDLVLNFPPGALAGLLLGFDATEALLLGGVTYISSSGIVAKVLTDLRRLPNRETPGVLSILVMEDLAMALYLPLLAVVLTSTGIISGTLLVLLAAAVAGGALIVAIRFGEPLSRLIAARSDEVLLLTTLGFVLIVAGAAEELRLSAAVGAFLAGIVLSGPVAARARALVAPLRDLFAAAFFVLFGLDIDTGGLSAVALPALALGVVTAATKVGSGWYAARALGAGRRGRMRAGTALIARGEFSIVIAALGVSAGLDPELASLAAAYVLLTALAGPLLTRWSDDLAALGQGRGGGQPAPAAPG